MPEESTGSASASNPKARRSFTEEFKREAVRLARERNNVAGTVRDLGIEESCLNRWRRALAGGQKPSAPGETPRPFPGKGNTRNEEVARLEHELARVKEENEILKKAVPPHTSGVGIFTSRPR